MTTYGLRRAMSWGPLNLQAQGALQPLLEVSIELKFGNSSHFQNKCDRFIYILYIIFQLQISFLSQTYTKYYLQFMLLLFNIFIICPVVNRTELRQFTINLYC